MLLERQTDRNDREERTAREREERAERARKRCEDYQVALPDPAALTPSAKTPLT